MNFSARLLEWYQCHGRQLPWRGSGDPYTIWISEIILQQTRVDQGVVYYRRFMASFPDVQSLAASSEEQVLRVWQGLGYYSRARNLHQAAREIATDRNGRFPTSYEEWLQLKGVGPYTAAAVASIAFGEPVPAIDGNVCRVLARIFALAPAKGKGNSSFRELALQLIDARNPGDFNQAMMDFGSLVCKPARPLCWECIFNRECLAFLRDQVHLFPVKKAKKKPAARYFNYILFMYQPPAGELVFFVRQRTADDIWKNLFELPLLETAVPATEEDVKGSPWWRQFFPNGDGAIFAGSPRMLKHLLSHQTIHAVFYPIMVNKEAAVRLGKAYRQVSAADFDLLPKPRLIQHFLQTAALD